MSRVHVLASAAVLGATLFVPALLGRGAQAQPKQLAACDSTVARTLPSPSFAPTALAGP